MELSEQDLLELAGWEAVKSARALTAAGSVLSAKQDQTGAGGELLLKGIVLEGRKKFSCGLRVRSLSDADNFCSCPAARRDGKICSHSVAVALQVLREAETAKSHPAEPEKESGGGLQGNNFKTNLTPLAWYPVGRLPLSEFKPGKPILVEFTQPPPDHGLAAKLPEQLMAYGRSIGIELADDLQLTRLSETGFCGLLGVFAGSEMAWGNSTGEGEGLRVASTHTRLPLHAVVESEDSGVITLRRPALPTTVALRGAEGVWLVDSDSLLAIRLGEQTTGAPDHELFASLLKDVAEEAECSIAIDVLRQHLDHLHCMFHMECSDRLMKSLRILEGQPDLRLHLEGSLRHLDLRLELTYPQGTGRNPRLEASVLGRLSGAELEDPVLEGGGPESLVGRWKGAIRGENAIMEFYAGALVAILGDKEWSVEIGERFATLTKEIERVRPRFENVGSGADWLEFNLSFGSSAGDGVPESEIRRLLESGQSRVRLANGRQGAIDRRALEGLFASLGEVDSERQAGSENPSRRIHHPEQQLFVQEVINEFTDKKEPSSAPEAGPETPGLEAELRPYQQAGLTWLLRRIGSRHGAILADEMGLGKTVQTLALIAALKPQAGQPVLIVCPTSLLGTWRHEAQRFLPSKKLLLLHGPKRARYFEVMHSADIVLTSYGSLVRDIDSYPEMEFKLAVADEASYLKNASTKAAKAATRIAAGAHLALTGTPVENTLADLWSIMAFTNPGYLGRRDDFLARYANTGPETADRLRLRLRPFLLRRTKAEVATDLPEKLEKIVYCDLTPSQQKIYERFVQAGRSRYEDLADSPDGWQRNRFEILTLLLRLRQTCCDLRLLNAAPAPSATAPKAESPPAAGKVAPSTAPNAADLAKLSAEQSSTKLGTLMALVESAVDGGHRCLVFSQFVGMLSLIREELDAAGHSYAYLDGSTPSEKRAEAVQAFQDPGSDIPLFLISLKAGGYGLTLTGADTVIHFDPWWNPAVEAQATDRAHRIGQTRRVTALKLIATGTVEEKILQLQQRKRNLIDATLDEQRPLMGSLTQEDVEFVLS